ncbi:hypothetical protein [Dongia mobilis]|nr:hypothetical protein [Dongia mobilis]
MENSFRGETIAVAPYDEQRGSLEFASHAKKFEAKLAAAGMRVVPYDPKAAPPRYVAFLDFSIDGGREVPYSYSVPTWGPTGITSSTTTGVISPYGTYSGSTTYQQSYGLTGYNQVTGTATQFTRYLYIDIMEVNSNGDVAQAYEARLVSSGSCGRLAAVMDSLLSAAFKNFPQETSCEVVARVPVAC